MKKIFLLALLALPVYLTAQINESELTTDGIVFPRMTTSQRNVLNAIPGQCIYNTDSEILECYTGNNWTFPHFSARLGVEYILPNFTETTIETFIEDLDPTNAFDNTTGVFTAPVNGLYHFDLKMSFSKDNEDFDFIPVIIRLKVNGNVIKAHGQIVDRITVRSNYGQDISYSTNVELEADDELTVTVNAISGSPTGNIKISYNNGSGDSSFSGYLIK